MPSSAKATTDGVVLWPKFAKVRKNRSKNTLTILAPPKSLLKLSIALCLLSKRGADSNCGGLSFVCEVRFESRECVLKRIWLTLWILNDFRIVRFHHCDAGIGSAQINSNGPKQDEVRLKLWGRVAASPSDSPWGKLNCYLRCEGAGALGSQGRVLSDKVSLSFEKCSQHLLCVTAWRVN